MGVFSPSEAALEGFRIIGRHWRVVVGWAVFNLVALVAMVVVTVVVSLGVAASAGGATELSGALGGIVALIGTAATEVILAAGLLRLMLRPEEPAFLHLRVGAQELRLFAVWTAMVLSAFLLIGFGAWIAGPAGRIAPIMSLIAATAVFCFGLWLALRFSLAPAATFAEQRVAFLTSWRLTKGQVWPLFGMAMLTACLIALVTLAVWLVVFILLAVLAGLHAVVEAMTDPEAITSHPGLYLALLFAQLLLAPVMAVLGAAPAIAAYQALAAKPD